MSTEISLLVNGERYANWLRYDADAQLEVPASAWSLSVRPPETFSLANVGAGDWAELMVGTNTVLSGRIDDVISNRRLDQVEITLRGRDQAALLLDFSAKLSWTFSNTTLLAIMTTVAQAVGMTQTPVTTDTGKLSAKAEPGESCWEFLDRIVRRRGLRLWVTPAGVLTAGEFTRTGSPVATLRRHTTAGMRSLNNIKSSNIVRTTRDGASKITVCGSWDDDSDSYAISGSYSNAGFPFTREIIFQDSDVESTAEAQKRAKEELTRRKAKEFKARYQVHGHVVGGVPLAPNQLVTVIDEVESFERLLLITGRRFVKNHQVGMITDLVLQVPGYFGA